MAVLRARIRFLRISSVRAFSGSSLEEPEESGFVFLERLTLVLAEDWDCLIGRAGSPLRRTEGDSCRDLCEGPALEEGSDWKVDRGLVLPEIVPTTVGGTSRGEISNISPDIIIQNAHRSLYPGSRRKTPFLPTVETYWISVRMAVHWLSF